jgi:hypothetical protein
MQKSFWYGFWYTVSANQITRFLLQLTPSEVFPEVFPEPKACFVTHPFTKIAPFYLYCK